MRRGGSTGGRKLHARGCLPVELLCVSKNFDNTTRLLTQYQFDSATNDRALSDALHLIRGVQDSVLRRTHESLSEWTSSLAKNVLELHDEDGAEFLRKEWEWISTQFEEISVHVAGLIHSTELYELVTGMVAHTRDTKASVDDLKSKLEAGELWDAYIECRLYSDLCTS